MGREVLHDYFFVLRQPGLHDPRLAVDLISVPHDCPGAAYLPFELLQEQHDFFAVEILVLAQQHEVQPHTQRPGTDRDGADQADPVVAVRTDHDRRLTTRGQGPPYCRRQQKARFVQQSDAGAASERLTEDARPVIGYPPLHLLVIALPRMLLGLLASPVQAPAEHPPQVVGVIVDAEVALNQHGNTRGGPQGVGPTVNQRPLAEQGFQGNPLLVRQSRRGAKGTLGSQAVRSPGQSSPTMQRGRRDTQDTRNISRRFSRIDEGNSPTPTSFQFGGTPNGSHALFYAPRRSKNVFPRAFLS